MSKVNINHFSFDALRLRIQDGHSSIRSYKFSIYLEIEAANAELR